jgi:GH15 family glucan-1,4-alpha-glucosidase
VPLRIEDYAIIGDTHTAALVGRDGSIDWMCAPRFDSAAFFAALLGTPDNGRWLVAPAAPKGLATRRYRGESLVLETEFEADEGMVRVIDFMSVVPQAGQKTETANPCQVIRIVEGGRGRVAMRMELVIRFDYGSVVPWMRRIGDRTRRAIAGPDALTLHTPVDVRGENLTTVAEFAVSPGDRVAFTLAWHPSHEGDPGPIDAEAAMASTEKYWHEWAGLCTQWSGWREPVVRSLLTLKALTFAPTGGVVAAATTSLPEKLGGVRNWDYRYCWLRDATFTLYALHLGGYREEAIAWRDWLLRAAAGAPADLQIMYGPAGERRLLEYEVPWLAGYESSAPVRVGNAASQQRQLDVYGEVMDALHLSRRKGHPDDPAGWDLQRVLLDFLESAWHEPDEGIWEVRGPRRHFTHSKVMAWVGFDRAIKDATRLGLEGPVDRWRAARAEVHDEVLEKGFNADRNSFVQYYGCDHVDASLLMIPMVGFLPATDARMLGTVTAIEQDLSVDGFVARYPMDEGAEGVDGLPAGEGAFLPCSFWLADNYALMGRHADAHRVFDRLLAVRNVVGLLSEEYDPVGGRLLGNFPQAFTHVGLINTAYNLSRTDAPANDRRAPDA